MAKITLKNIFYFNQGYIRSFLYNYFPFLIRKHIKQQYKERLLKAKDCVDNGMCLYCGCKTPELMFCNKACGLEEIGKELRIKLVNKENICYNKMLNKKEWKNYLKEKK